MKLTLRFLDEHAVPAAVRAVVTKDGAPVFRGYADAETTLTLDPGRYTVTITRGKLYRLLESTVVLAQDAPAVEAEQASAPEQLGDGSTLIFRLVRLFDPKTEGFYSFDAHSHVSRRCLGPDAPMDSEKASVWMRAEDINVFWAGTPYDGENHLHVYRKDSHADVPSYRAYYRDAIARAARPDFLLDFGGEFIKYRYGHVTLANFDESSPVDKYRDPLYHAYEQNRHVPSTEEPPFVNVPPSRALATKRNENSFAFFCHPTSWWRLDRSDGFITNISSTAAFDALTGVVDAIVVQGYGADKANYRAVWYELLNAGCRLTGVAETDSCPDGLDHLNNGRPLDPFRTYARSGGLSLDGISAAVRRGDCFATSGPFLDYTLNGARPGTVLPFEEGAAYRLDLRAVACREGALKRVDVVVNGNVVTSFAPTPGGPDSVTVTLPCEGWVLAILYDDAKNVAVGNPVYVRNSPFLNDGFRAHVTLDVIRDGQGANGTFVTDESSDPVVFDGRVVCDVNPMSRIYVTVAGQTQTYEPFFDARLQSYFRYTYSGDFLRDYPDCRQGEVPAAAFRIPEIVDRLRRLDGTLDFGYSPEFLARARSVAPFHTELPDPSAKANPFRALPPYSGTVPTEQEFLSSALPELFWEGHEDVCAAMKRAFEICAAKLRAPSPESGYPAPLLYTEFANSVFMWGNCFNTMYGVWGRRAFPFIRLLDNFYAKQHDDGFICRQLHIRSGSDQFEEYDLSSTGPDIFSLAEWRWYEITGDASRLQRVYPVLLAFHRWLKRYRTWQDGSYFSTGWGSGMDNVPRSRRDGNYNRARETAHLSFIDTTAQQALDARLLLRIAEVCGITEGTAELRSEFDALYELVNRTMWSEADVFYEDRYPDGALTGVMHVGAYWTLLAGLVPEARLERFVSHLSDENEFLAPTGVRSLSRTDPGFNPEGGNYWQGGVWCITDFMIFLGLTSCGCHELAHELAARHVEAVAEVCRATGTIWESYDPLSVAPGRLYGNLVRRDFVGFSGVAPISLALEGVLGVTVRGTEVSWDVRLTEAHGVRDLPVGDGSVSLEYADSVVTVTSTLDAAALILNGRRHVLPKGVTKLTVS